MRAAQADDQTTPAGKYPDTFYRVSVKALIWNGRGEVLVVKEHQDLWELPGGGLDHGETVHECLERELCEELGLTLRFSESFNRVDAKYMPSRPDHELDFWKLSLYFDVILDGDVESSLARAPIEACFRPASELLKTYG